MTLENQLVAKLKPLEYLALNPQELTECAQDMSAYIGLIAKWGKAMNLTAVLDPFSMVDRHIIDSLALVPFLKDSQHILDVGTGAGLPGIPLSSALKQKQFTLLDSKVKKQLFLEQVVQVLKLKNVSLQCTRVESYKVEVLFDTIISRAFAPLGKMLSLTGHLLAPGGRFLAMKGKIDAEELASVPANYTIESVINLESFTNNQTQARHLIVVKRTNED